MKHFLVIVLLVTFSGAVLSQSFYKTPTGKKYHLASCRMVNNVSEKITIERALKLNLEPCNFCQPSAKANKFKNGSVDAKGQGKTVQCKAIKKNGQRCRHRTRIANGYCFQHNPDKVKLSSKKVKN